MEPESSSPYPQVTAIRPYPEPTPSSPHDLLDIRRNRNRKHLVCKVVIAIPPKQSILLYVLHFMCVGLMMTQRVDSCHFSKHL